MPTNDDTIAAISTPIGQAGIGIIRISGPTAFKVAKRIFLPKKTIQKIISHHLYLGNLINPASGELLDEVLVSFMKAPHSYTREDVVEINSHSGYFILFKILEIIQAQDIRLARPGEFTLRAFMNGRIDLTQAEAVMDLINCQSTRGLNLASQQIKGAFKKTIISLIDKGLEILSHVEAAIDFSEEELELPSMERVNQLINEDLIKPTIDLIAIHTMRQIWIDGVKTVIAGRVNTGKSSILNLLLNEEKAIVTSIPGTTRDTVESTINLEGIPIRLMDTAGFRKGGDEAEKIGINLTEQNMSNADLILIVVDQSQPLSQEDLAIKSKIEFQKVIIILNKVDLPSKIDTKAIEKGFSPFSIVQTSALTGQGLNNLKKTIIQCITNGDIDMSSSQAVPNLRHKKALQDAEGYFHEAIHCIKQGAPNEIIALELKNGLDALGSITGEMTNENVLAKIFSQFCLGK